MAWTDEMVEDLRRMWKEGLTTGEIGKRLNVSKNSIVGKVHRLGLSGRPSPIKKKENTQTEPKTKEAQAKQIKEPVKETPKPAVKKETEPQVKNPSPAPKAAAEPRHKAGHNISLTDLDNHTCRWPIGDPKDDNFHFCGKKVRIGQTYCEEHAAVAYVKPSKK